MSYLDLLQQVTELTAENERLREHIGASGIAYLEQLRARVAALEAALQEYLDSHDFSLEASTMHKGAKCPCRDCQRARAALARPTPRRGKESGDE